MVKLAANGIMVKIKNNDKIIIFLGGPIPAKFSVLGMQNKLNKLRDLTLAKRREKLYIIATLTLPRQSKAKSILENKLMRDTGFEPANSCETGS